ncbi:hypothetical protein [Comamonas thiooxydans]|uniref:hypothetical protein n=1 Tax=Comamonas thiooxydans TaxID=363952 RepID=UPI0005F7A0D2|nr:hypothetical protein [Comamonas thiooxydans]CUA97824.1 hypothetical protein Ga0061062_106187 [Comamonas thiooxydans]
MRPAGEISLAIEQTVQQLWTPERAPTLAEIAAHLMASAPVAFKAIRQTVGNMKRYGRLVQVRERKVPGRNRPAAEYGRPQTDSNDAANDAVFGLSQALQLWG